ncbi:MAG: bifunctional phosphoglucose/phosphomannose isomerase [Anaerolineales bacterium]|nr:bifunctional phosphoglucose/phosphomannose isomerase [Anaerolineales bacterium]MDW8447675.1 bifunctional phosphoglucose/phosphomannose isomerase [Anaerolineales bacterium]
MNLDDLSIYPRYDQQDMLWHIQHVADQLWQGWELGMGHDLPTSNPPQQIVIVGVGGSAIGADLVLHYAAPQLSIPLILVRDYELPAWASGPSVFVVGSSHSGNTEEVLYALELSHRRKCSLIGISTGGKLADLARRLNFPHWRYEHQGQPRAAVGYSFSLLLALLYRLKVIPNPSAELQSAVQAISALQPKLSPQVPTVQNLAKRMAGQLIGRWVSIYGAGFLAPVARRWKTQINELAKAWAQFEEIPEANHNTLTGTQNPEALVPQIVALFLRSRFLHPRHQQRLEMTQREFMIQGLGTDFIDAEGETPLAHLWTCLLIGDYIAYYLAIAYGVDPTPIDILENFKRDLAKIPFSSTRSTTRPQDR